MIVLRPETVNKLVVCNNGFVSNIWSRTKLWYILVFIYIQFDVLVSGWAEVCCLSDTDLIPNITIQVLPGVLPMPTGMAAKHTVENVLVLDKIDGHEFRYRSIIWNHWRCSQFWFGMKQFCFGLVLLSWDLCGVKYWKSKYLVWRCQTPPCECLWKKKGLI